MTESKTYKVYEYNTMMKTSLLLLPVFSVVAVISNMFGNLRYILMLTLASATFWGIIGKLKKKFVFIKLGENTISINNKKLHVSEIENYFTCLPLNELFMLRITTKNGKEVFYIKKKFRTEIENVMNNYHIPFKKTNNDIWLKYSHLKFAFICLFISFIIHSLFQRLMYSLL